MPYGRTKIQGILERRNRLQVGGCELWRPCDDTEGRQYVSPSLEVLNNEAIPERFHLC